MMRKPRAIICDDDSMLLTIYEKFFMLRGYDALTFQKPQFCPIYGDDADCENVRPCADIILSDYFMPWMTGVEMFSEQSRKGCRVPAKNRAIMSGNLDERGRKGVLDLGCAFFQKPFSFNELSVWLDGCEQRMDLSQPLGMLRREQRTVSGEKITLLSAGERVFNGIAVNMSLSGLCLKTEAPLRQGETLTVRPGLPRPSGPASVRWVKNIGDGLSMTGLLYDR